MQYYQVRSLITKLIRNKLLRTDLSKFEGLLAPGAIYKKSLSKIYMLLLQLDQPDKKCRVKWEWEWYVGKEILESDWIKSSKHLLDISANIAIH